MTLSQVNYNPSLFSFTFEALFDTMKVNFAVKDVDYEK